LNQIKKQIYRAVLPSRPVLIDDRVNGDGGVNARQLVSGLIGFKGLHDRDGAVLTIIGISAPPHHAEDLAWKEVVHAASLPFFMVIGRRAEAKAIEPGVGNVTSGETGQADWAQTTPPSLLQFDAPNITLTVWPESREKCAFWIHSEFTLSCFSIDGPMAMMFTGDMERASRTVRVSGERLASLWRESAMSQESFAHAIGMKRSGFIRLMQPGEHGMFTDNFRRMAEAVQSTPDKLRSRISPAGEVELEGAGVAPVRASRAGDHLAGVSGVAQPLREITQFHGISAGTRNERMAVEQGTVKVPQDFGDFAVRVDGESMSPEYPDNAVVLFETVEGQQVNFGKDYLIWFTNDECYFSRVTESDDDRDVLVLKKINPDRERFPDRTVHRREIARVALCVGVLIRKK
jgi:phage repressor protein C with HTH and peptisase S24 domain